MLGGGALLSALSPAAAMAKGGKGRPPAKFGKGDVGILNSPDLGAPQGGVYNAASQ